MLDSVRRSFVPTLAQARASAQGEAAELPATEPVTQATFVAVLVYARSLHRRSWTDQVELGPELLARLQERRAPDDGGVQSARYALLESLLDVTPRPCTTCGVRPGVDLCPSCRGRNILPLVPCSSACKEGWVPCARCEGTGHVQRAIVRHVEEDVVLTRAVALPQAPCVPWLEDRLHADAIRMGSPPLGLLLSASAEAGSPYRGGKPAPPRFLDFSLAEAWEVARAKAERLQRAAGSLRVDFRAFGWPVYAASWYGKELAVVMGFDAGIQCFVRDVG